MLKIANNPKERIIDCINFSWNLCLHKISGGEIIVNKEASLQLQYASILKGIFDLMKIYKGERFDIELESGFRINNKSVIADIVVKYSLDHIVTYTHVIEMKFYRTFTSHNTRRGAQDIFMCEVYKDLYHSELYLEHEEANGCSILILTDCVNFIYPKSKATKCWVYDISDNCNTEIKLYDVQIGGKPISFELKKSHCFLWEKIGSYYQCHISL